MPTKIQWTDETWNPVSGCTRISAGCDHCYIERTPPFRMAHRKFDSPEVGGTTGVRLHPERLTQPWRWRKPRKVFVCSLADLFHDEVPDDHIAAVFGAMVSSPHHIFQVLTKRPARMRSLLGGEEFRFSAAAWAGANSEDGDNVHDWVAHGTWPWPNIWLGVTAETQRWANIRVPTLLDTPAAVRFVSAEPLLGPVDLRRWIGHEDEHGPWHYTEFGVSCSCGAPCVNEVCQAVRLNWVIGGGESGPGARPSDPDWFRGLRDQCVSANVAYHFKQFGEWAPAEDIDPDSRERATEAFIGQGYVCRVGKKAAGRLLDGRTWDEFPSS